MNFLSKKKNKNKVKWNHAHQRAVECFNQHSLYAVFKCVCVYSSFFFTYNLSRREMHYNKAKNMLPNMRLKHKLLRKSLALFSLELF